MEILKIVIGVSIPLLGHLGLMIWWMSKTNTKIELLSSSMKEHITEDKEVVERVQALEVGEANVGGTLSNLALQLELIRKDLDHRELQNGHMLQLKLDKQSSELINKFRDMLQAENRENRR